MMWTDDISFCQKKSCRLTSCPRNQANIRDRTIPHSFVDTPPDCPKLPENNAVQWNPYHDNSPMGEGEIPLDKGGFRHADKSSVKHKDIAKIMNAIVDALEPLGYEPVGYDNTDTFLQVLIDKI